MTWYLFTAIGFPPGSSGQKECTKIEKTDSAEGETIHKTVQKTENTQNRKQYETKKTNEKITKNK